MDELTIPFLGNAGLTGSTRSGRWRRLSAAMCAGSDWPVSSPNPLWGRTSPSTGTCPPGPGGHGGDPFLPGQAIGLTSILTAYTSGSARINGLGTVTGSIAEGYNADLAVVNADLAHLPAGEISPGGGHPDLDPWSGRVLAGITPGALAIVAQQCRGRARNRGAGPDRCRGGTTGSMTDLHYLARDGVPTGLSVVGKTYDGDVAVFRVAAAHEERMPWLDMPRRYCTL